MDRSFVDRLGLHHPFYGWYIALAAAVVTFATGPGQSYVFSIFVDPLLADTGMSRTQLSALYALGTGVSAAMAMVASRLSDRFGSRAMLIVLALAFGVACFGMSVAVGPLGVLLGFAALRALGQGSLPVTATLLVAQWFVRARGRAMAVLSLGAAASTALFPPFAQALIATLGWRGAYQVLGITVWLLVLPLTLFVVRNRPEAIGLTPDGLPLPKTVPLVGQGAPVIRRAAWRTRGFWLLALALTAGPFVITALVFHQASIFVEHGLSREVAAGVFVAFAIAAACASTIGGVLIDRFGPRPVLFASLALLCAATLGLNLIATPLAAVLYAVVLGFSGGTQSVVGGAIWAHYYGRDGLGAVQGPAAMVMIAASALAPLPLAALEGAFSGYTVGLLIFSVVPLLCAVLLAAHRQRPVS